MTSSPNDMGIDRLTLQERLDLIAVIWDSIAEKPEAFPMPEWHREELDTPPGSCRSGTCRRDSLGRSQGAVARAVMILPVILRPECARRCTRGAQTGTVALRGSWARVPRRPG